MTILLDGLVNLPWIIAKALLSIVLGIVIIFELLNACLHGKLTRPCFIEDLENAIKKGISFVGDAFFNRHN